MFLCLFFVCVILAVVQREDIMRDINLEAHNKRRLFGPLQSDEYRLSMSHPRWDNIRKGFETIDRNKVMENSISGLPEMSEEQKRNVYAFLIATNKRLGWDDAIPIAIKYLVDTLGMTEKDARFVYRIVSARILLDEGL